MPPLNHQYVHTVTLTAEKSHSSYTMLEGDLLILAHCGPYIILASCRTSWLMIRTMSSLPMLWSVLISIATVAEIVYKFITLTTNS